MLICSSRISTVVCAAVRHVRKAWENRRNDSMGQVKNNDSFLGKAEKLKPVLKHRMLRPVGVVSFERKKADSGADFWNTVGIERLGILSVMLSDEPLAYRGIVIPLLGSYWGGSQGLSSTYEQAHVDLDLLTLASIYKRIIAHNPYFIQVYCPAASLFKRPKNCRLYKIDSVSCDSGIFDCTIPDIT